MAKNFTSPRNMEGSKTLFLTAKNFTGPRNAEGLISQERGRFDKPGTRKVLGKARPKFHKSKTETRKVLLPEKKTAGTRKVPDLTGTISQA